MADDKKETPEQPVEPEPIDPLQPIPTEPAWNIDLGAEIVMDIDLEAMFRTKDLPGREER